MTSTFKSFSLYSSSFKTSLQSCHQVARQSHDCLLGLVLHFVRPPGIEIDVENRQPLWDCWCLRFCIVKTYREHEHVDIFEQGDVILEIIFFEVLHVKLLGCSYFYRCCKMLTFQSKWKWRQAEINGEQLREAHPGSQ